MSVPTLEEYLFQNNLLSPEQLKLIQIEQDKKDLALEEILLNSGLVSEVKLLEYKALKWKIPFHNLEGISPDPEIVTLIPEDVAQAKVVLPLKKENNSLIVAMADPLNIMTIDEIQSYCKLQVKPILSPKGAILKKLSEYHEHYRSFMVEKLLNSITDQGLMLSQKIGLSIENLEQVSEQSTTIKTVNLIILQALQKRASDIHLEPSKKFLHIRYRIDGVLHETQILPINMAPSIISRIKIMSNLNIAERRLPQDGHFQIHIEGKDIDFRVATSPTIFGEKITMRVLDKSNIILGMDYLGFSEDILKKIHYFIRRPHGIIIISGPTGSGKTSTLYAALQAINSKEKNITTVEDPVEYQIEGINQIQVNEQIGLTFAHVLRSVLRHDPDVILIGEIRDIETTQIAIRSSLTGHLVFATLHTNDAAAAIARLIDMGAEPYLLASTIRCIVNQRLIRTICFRCKESYEISSDYLKTLGLTLADKTVNLYRGRGCRNCFNTGFKGRTVIAELLQINDEIRRLIVNKSTAAEISSVAISQGMKSIRHDGLEKVLKGITTLEEVLHVTEDIE